VSHVCYDADVELHPIKTNNKQLIQEMVVGPIQFAEMRGVSDEFGTNTPELPLGYVRRHIKWDIRAV